MCIRDSAAPDLGHAAVYVQQGVDSLHAGADGVLGREDQMCIRDSNSCVAGRT